MNSSVILILGKAKDWVSNSTVNIKRQKSQSHRVLCRGNAKGSSSSFKLKRGSGHEAEVLVWSLALPLPGLTDAAGHRSDKSRALPTAVLRFQEGHVTFGSQIFHCLVHDFGKAGKRERRGVTGLCLQVKLETRMKMRSVIPTR